MIAIGNSVHVAPALTEGMSAAYIWTGGEIGNLTGGTFLTSEDLDGLIEALTAIRQQARWVALEQTFPAWEDDNPL